MEWPEEANPYSVLASSLSASFGTVFVDGHIRKFISDGLQAALLAATIVSAPDQVTQLRKRKSEAEINLLKCANEVKDLPLYLSSFSHHNPQATLLSIRDVHQRMYIGMHESEARSMMISALAAGGLRDGDCLTLFGGLHTS